MSLQALANSIQNQGRGKDSMLVHMTPGEVAGLQSLALAHGGSLTINPHTGLPEAGILGDFFESVGSALPAIAGIGASMMGLPAWGVGLASGLTSYATNRDPSRALMSGLLSGGLSGLGNAFGEVGRNTAMDIVDPLAMGPQLPSSLGVAAPAQLPAISKPDLYGLSQADEAALLGSGYDEYPRLSSNMDKLPQATQTELPQPQPVSFGTPGTFTSPYTTVVQNQNPELLGSQKLGDVAAGIKQVTSSPSGAWNFIKANPYAAGATALGALGSTSPAPAAIPLAKTGYADTNYSFNAPEQVVDPVTGQVRLIPASYTRGSPTPYTYYANGGAVPYPAGGIGYPQQNVMDKTDFYAQSTANPTPTSVIGAAPKTDYDARITQQGDEFKAAAGGKINSYRSYNKPLGVNEPNEPNQPVKGFKAGGPYGSTGPIYGVAGPIYGGNSSKVGPYQSTDAYSGVRQQMDKMSPAKLKILAEDATDPIVMAAAQDEIYSRASAAPSGYIEKPTIQAAEGGTVKMADGGLPGLWGLLLQSGLFGPMQTKPVQYSYDPRDQRYTQMAQGGIASPGEYAAGGKLLQGPGDGMSDSIPAVIKGAKPQRAALAQGEFVIPADVVSHLGNGSTDAGAKRLYGMMDKIRMARTGTKKQGRQINPEKFMPA